MRKALIGAAASILFLPATGHAQSSKFVRSYDCDPAAVKKQRAAYRDSVPDWRSRMPETGWTACELLARRGGPKDVDVQRAPGSEVVTWWYRTGIDGSDLHMVSLKQFLRIKCGRLMSAGVHASGGSPAAAQAYDDSLTAAGCKSRLTEWRVTYVGW